MIDSTELRTKLRGFYAVLDRDDRDLARALLDASSILQVRLKPATRDQVRQVVRWARELTAARGAQLVVNDDLELALEVGADAVHLGQDDLPLEVARARRGEAGSDLRIGISTHTPQQVRDAVAGGADYLGFGPVFATTTKANPDPTVGLDQLAAAVRLAAPLPVVAIGGIALHHAAAIARTGAAAACAISSVNRTADPTAAGRTLAAPFASSR